MHSPLQFEVPEREAAPTAGVAEVAAPLAARRAVITDPRLKGRKEVFPHRIHLANGRIFEGLVFREPGSRLCDDLYGIKGDFLSVLDARCVRSGEVTAFMVVNLNHVVCIEEL